MTDGLSERWQQCKDTLRVRLTEEDATAWLPSLELTSLSASKAVLSGIPNSFLKNRIIFRFVPLLKECLGEAFAETRLAEDFSLDLRVGAGAGHVQGTAPGGHSEAGEAPPAPGGGQTFASFVQGEANRHALRFAQETAAAPGGRFNPLFIVSETGFGKSHLLRALAGEAAARQPGFRAVYCTAEEFANDVLDGMRRQRMKAIREHYRGADMLLLDDVEFLLVTRRTQEELLHTFDALHGSGRQLVFSGDRYPGAMKTLLPALRSRLEMGLVTELGPPEAALRREVLLARAHAHGISLQPEVAELLASRIGSGFRQLEGALVRMAAYGSMRGRPLDLELAAEVAAPFFDPEAAPEGLTVPPDTVLGEVGDYFGLTVKELRSPNRARSVSRARRVAAHLLHTAADLSAPEIGAALGNRSHSTIAYALKKAGAELAADAGLQHAVTQIRRALKNGSGA